MNTPRIVPDKPALTIDEQVARLRRRGMNIADEERARHYLANLNYYRLRGYWMRDELPGGKGDHAFRPGTDFDAVIGLYDFDRRLRLELNDAIERVEVSLRTCWAYVLGHAAGPDAHRQDILFNERHATLLLKLETLYADRNEVFLSRYLGRNEEPPVWALCEVLSLGDLSKWLRSIRDHKIRQRIAEPFGLAETPFCSFVEHLAYVRNVCAHHSRLWNRKLVVGTLALPKKPAELHAQLQTTVGPKDRIYNTLVLLLWLMARVSPASEWRQRIRALMLERSDLWNEMGFPLDWQSFDIWREFAE